MNNIDIPPFIKNMGHQIIGYILNLGEEDAKGVLEGTHNIDPTKRTILEAFIKLCLQLRAQAIDQPDIDSLASLGFANIIENNRHIFNLWHEKSGGITPRVNKSDKIVYLLSKLALEIYPLFLLKFSNTSRMFSNTYVHISASLYQFPDQKVLFDEIIKDTSLKKMFSKIGKNASDTTGYFVASSGRGGGLQLAVIPSTIITNAYELMRLRDKLSQDSLISSIAEVVKIMRSVAEDDLVQIPVFLGFHNIGLDDFSSLDTDLGLLRSYNEGLLELIPQEAKPSTIGSNQMLGLILESEYPYKVNFRSKDQPMELNQTEDFITNLKEDLSLTFSLAIKHTPPVGITLAWTLKFDPLSLGANISWNLWNRLTLPSDPYLCNRRDRKSIQKWSSIIKSIDDRKIRIAIRRILSSINERLNPADGFVDSVIALENLFGGETELRFRISAAIACLLVKNLNDRLELQKKVSDLYGDRSKIVHGTREITYEEAIDKRNKCNEIAIDCLRLLYTRRPELIPDPERAKKLILQ